MLNQTSHAASPLLDDIDPEDRRVEIAAARHVALVMALKFTTNDKNAVDAVAKADVFEAFMLDHPATGQQALNMALQFCHYRGSAQPAVVCDTAAVFAAYLENGQTPVPTDAA